MKKLIFTEHSGKPFRPPVEFRPHLTWLETGMRPNTCGCKLCRSYAYETDSGIASGEEGSITDMKMSDGASRSEKVTRIGSGKLLGKRKRPNERNDTAANKFIRAVRVIATLPLQQYLVGSIRSYPFHPNPLIRFITTGHIQPSRLW